MPTTLQAYELHRTAANCLATTPVYALVNGRRYPAQVVEIATIPGVNKGAPFIQIVASDIEPAEQGPVAAEAATPTPDEQAATS